MRLFPATLILGVLCIALSGRCETAAEMKPYSETIPGTDVKFDLVPIPGGKFMMGSPETEAGRGKDESPQHEVEIKPLWVGTCEVTWDEYDVFAFQMDIKKRKQMQIQPNDLDKAADACTRPTPPYADMTFGKGHDRYPAMCITHHAAMEYCRWLSAKTGKDYRLLTEAEWEYCARAGGTKVYGVTDDPKALDDYAWHVGNAGKKPHPVGQKKPNAWGLYDMEGNVGEWVLDLYQKDYFEQFKGKTAVTPVLLPTDKEYPYNAKGGSWQDKPEDLRVARRLPSNDDYSIQDPQLPQSVWWHTDALHVGFRICRPLEEQENLKGFRSPIKRGAER
ncbi:MAG TPA: formylglycine-generating enzyme family protein [Planctomycetota bacterium]|nr:formylglycine-generating enzyme family protein [Planctomycetota bacterium]